MDKLDIDMMSKINHGKQDKILERKLDILNLRNKIRLAYERENFILSFKTWKKKGEDLSYFYRDGKIYMLFGIGELKIKKLSVNEFFIKYKIYYSDNKVSEDGLKFKIKIISEYREEHS